MTACTTTINSRRKSPASRSTTRSPTSSGSYSRTTHLGTARQTIPPPRRMIPTQPNILYLHLITTTTRERSPTRQPCQRFTCASSTRWVPSVPFRPSSRPSKAFSARRPTWPGSRTPSFRPAICKTLARSSRSAACGITSKNRRKRTTNKQKNTRDFYFKQIFIYIFPRFLQTQTLKQTNKKTATLSHTCVLERRRYPCCMKKKTTENQITRSAATNSNEPAHCFIRLFTT
uniref:(northern house mosquito) hypothetical protein n=1 Tax=Culex pipiens TaxID=7175 RepID=A0A8D8ALE2_CULPI